MDQNNGSLTRMLTLLYGGVPKMLNCESDYHNTVEVTAEYSAA